MDNSKAAGRRSQKPSARRWIQLYAALLYNAHLKGFFSGQIYQGAAKYACVPGLNCYSCPGAVGACPLGAIQNALAATGHRAGWYVLGIVLLYGAALGRTVCGWLCPVGLIQELLHKIPTPKLGKSRVTRALSWVKYAVLGAFVVAVPLYYGLRFDLPLPAFCKYICPAGTSEGAVALLANPANARMFGMLGLLFTRKLVILLAVGLGCVFCYRGFCRFLCPLGALYGLFDRFNLIGARVDANRCNGCGACLRHCEMDVKRVGDHECIHCGKCIPVCSQKAISIRAGRIALLGPEVSAATAKKRGRTLWAVALAALALALLWFNLWDPAAKPPEPLAFESDAPVGSAVGQRLADFELACYDGGVFRLSDQLGRVTLINLWATYCAPCLNELPYFSDLCASHGDDVSVLAVHPSLVTEDPAAYIEGRGYAMRFATDDGTLAGLVGYAGALPQTIVLNRRGEVTYNQAGSVTPEALEALYQAAAE